MKNLYQQAGDKVEQVSALRLCADLCLPMRKEREAVRALEEGISLTRASRDSRREVEMKVMVSQAHMAELLASSSKRSPAEIADTIVQGEQKALQPAQEAVVLARKLNDLNLLAYALHGLADVYFFRYLIKEAISYGNEAVSAYHNAENPSGEATAMLLVAQAYQADKMPGDAQDFLSKAMALFQSANDQSGLEMAQKVAEDMRSMSATAAAASAALLPVADATPTADSGAAVVPAKQGMDYNAALALVKENALDAIGGDEEELQMDSPLMDVGLDSLAAVAFRETLRNASGLDLPSSLVFDYPSMRDVVAHMIELSKE